jgi:hypothetical protein
MAFISRFYTRRDWWKILNASCTLLVTGNVIKFIQVFTIFSASQFVETRLPLLSQLRCSLCVLCTHGTYGPASVTRVSVCITVFQRGWLSSTALLSARTLYAWDIVPRWRDLYYGLPYSNLLWLTKLNCATLCAYFVRMRHSTPLAWLVIWST